MYIVGYTVNGQDLALRSWYMDSVWAVTPGEGSRCNVFRDYAAAEKYYKRAVSEFRWNLKEEYRGGRVWIRRVNSSKNPFKVHITQNQMDVSDLGKYGWIKSSFSLKSVDKK